MLPPCFSDQPANRLALASTTYDFCSHILSEIHCNNIKLVRTRLTAPVVFNLPQSISSELSKQSSTPSQTKSAETHISLRHRNSCGPQRSVKTTCDRSQRTFWGRTRGDSQSVLTISNNTSSSWRLLRYTCNETRPSLNVVVVERETIR